MRPRTRACPRISAEVARSALAYDPGTGVLVRRKDASRADRLNNLGYRVAALGGERHLAHRLAWLIVTGEWPAQMLDHINGDRADNRWSNLREADKSINAQNLRGPLSTNTSGFLGVSRDKRRLSRPWRAAIRIRGKHVSLGNHETPEAAYAAYLKAKCELHPGCGLVGAANNRQEGA